MDNGLTFIEDTDLLATIQMGVKKIQKCSKRDPDASEKDQTCLKREPDPSYQVVFPLFGDNQSIIIYQTSIVNQDMHH